MNSLRINVTAYRLAGRSDHQTGLLAYLVLEIDGTLRLEDVTLRETRDGRLTLAFPRLWSRRGDPVEPVRPIDRDARQRIETEVLRQLGIDRDTQQNFAAHSHPVPRPDRHPELRGES